MGQRAGFSGKSQIMLLIFSSSLHSSWVKWERSWPIQECNRRCQITGEEIKEHIAYLLSVSRLVEPEVGMPVVLNDPNDDPVVYTAIGAGAGVLCARDRDFYAPNVIAFCQRYKLDIMDDIQLLGKLDAQP
jgi:hypothetical protein